MKTSTKILVGYIAAVILFSLTCYINTRIQRNKLEPIGKELAEIIDRTEIHNVEVEIPEKIYNKMKNNQKPYFHINEFESFKGLFLTKNENDTGKTVSVNSNLEYCQVKGDTFYIKIENDINHWFFKIKFPEIQSKTIITPEGRFTERFD